MQNQKCLILVLVGVFVLEAFAAKGKSSKKSLWPIKFPVKNNRGTTYYSMERLPQSKFEDASKFAVKHLKVNTGSANTYWKEELEKNLSVVIFKPGTQTIIGLNILDIRTLHTKSKFVCDRIFDMFSIDKYLISEGLAVDPNYRRQGLGEALLRVHVTICLEQHVDITASLFISDSSNRLANKLNYTCLDRLSAENLAKMKEKNPEKYKDTNEIACKYLAYSDIEANDLCVIM
ncbi:uncharacterized protein LOC116351976 [Contarinia nasturtii]|uniref:uncharacterized protein LOC116351976 n=1 Tax=Contarinia nasturtii TaxID=265458 RepID=UPI0012D47018|nr:uncharacterized protein LOC116351976 [Contarinia nasturtii]